jgi:hypothetical protein
MLLAAAHMTGAWAQASAAPDSFAVRLVEALERDGLISPINAKLAGERLSELLLEQRKGVGSSVKRYISLGNFVKVVAVLFFLQAVWMTVLQIIGKIGIALWFIITQVPVEVYQGAFLASSMVGLMCASNTSHEMYVALFCAFANLIFIFWIVVSHKQLVTWLEALAKYLDTHSWVPANCIGAFIGVVYFGVLAIAFSSEIFGFFTVVCLASSTSFGLSYSSHVLTMYFHQGMINQVIFGNLAVVSAFTALRVLRMLPPYGQLFLKGVDFYCTVALGTGLLIGSSPIESVSNTSAAFMVYMLLFFVIWAAAMMVYFLAEIKAIGSVLSVFAVLTVLEWLAIFSSSVGAILCCFVMGTVLYGGVVLSEGRTGKWLWLHCTQLWNASA